MSRHVPLGSLVAPQPKAREKRLGTHIFVQQPGPLSHFSVRTAFPPTVQNHHSNCFTLSTAFYDVAAAVALLFFFFFFYPPADGEK